MASPRSAFALPALLVAVLSGCDRTAPHPPTWPELPGVEPGESQWFWRDVLAAPLPGEPPPRADVLDRDPPARVVDGLAELVLAGDPAAPTTLLAALGSPHDGVAMAAARALGTGGHELAIPRLIKGIGPYPVDYDPSLERRVAQASALARLAHPAGMSLLLDVLAEDTGIERATEELAWTRKPQMVFARELALEGLVALAGDDFGYRPNGSVPDREAAAGRARGWWEARRLRLWSEAGPFDAPGLATRIRLLVGHLGAYQLRQIDGARFTLASLGPAVLPYLEEGLGDPDDYVRVHVLEVMARLTDVADDKTRSRLAVVAAGPLLDDPSPAVAAAAAAVSGRARVVGPLAEAARRRTEPGVRLAVVDALGRTRRRAAADVLARFETDGAAAPDLAAALAAARLTTTEDARPDALLRLLASPRPAEAWPARERLVALTGDAHGIDPSVPPSERQAGLDAARAALEAVAARRPD